MNKYCSIVLELVLNKYAPQAYDFSLPYIYVHVLFISGTVQTQLELGLSHVHTTTPFSYEKCSRQIINIIMILNLLKIKYTVNKRSLQHALELLIKQLWVFSPTSGGRMYRSLLPAISWMKIRCLLWMTIHGAPFSQQLSGGLLDLSAITFYVHQQYGGSRHCTTN